MSDSHSGHELPPGHLPGDHVPHVLPLSVYFGVFAALIAFTGITVGISYVDLGSANFFVSMFVATCKALMVSLIFMHIAFENKFNALLFSLSVLFLAVFIGIVLTDTAWRGVGGRQSEDKVVDMADPFANSINQEKIRKQFEKKAPEAPTEAHGEAHGTEAPAHH